MRTRLGVLLEMGRFIVARRVWWLAPIALALALVAIVTFLGSATPLAPFFYPLF